MATRKTPSKAASDTQAQAPKGENREQIRQRQFPAKAGAPDVEVDERSADGAKGTRHIKEFVVPAARWTGEDYQHEANRAALVGEAIQRGLHPRGDVAFDGQEEHPDGVSLILSYSVETVPSSVDHQPEDTTTPRDVIESDGSDTSSSKSEG
ncbi:hypothetical protein ACH4UM_23885 [Streptomyces sp. NPDC020801]|uniref:hypothetical protein n=1 Tax=Streptomyces sp. NPDC020801 TaxID=3365093 RepID=UPI0037B5A6A8